MSTLAPPVKVEVTDRVQWIHLSRPEVLNAISHDLLEGLEGALDRAAADDVRVVIIRGTGRAFSVGADLKEIGSEPYEADRVTSFVRHAATVISRLADFPKPVIAGVNGVTAAGGLEIVLACDLVVAARSSRLADGHSNYGLIPGAGGSSRLPRRVGPQVAKRLMFTGEFLEAEELREAGLITEVVDDHLLDERLSVLGQLLVGRSPRVLAAMKRLVADALEQPFATSAAQEFAEVVEHARTGDIAEGLAAFREGRPPRFEG